MKLEILQEDIQAARDYWLGVEPTRRSQSCPVAQAMKRSGFADVTVSLTFCEIAQGDVQLRVKLPPEMTEYIKQADRQSDQVEPASFELNVPSGFLVADKEYT